MEVRFCFVYQFRFHLTSVALFPVPSPGRRRQLSIVAVELRMRRMLKRLVSHKLVLATGLLAVMSTAALPDTAWNRVGQLLLPPLTDRFELPPLEGLEGYAGIIVAGGSPSRVHEAGRLARAFPHLELYISSAGEPDEVMPQLNGGVEPNRVEIENLARTTYENAQYAKRFLSPRPGQQWILVTSAFHMPRAMGTFRAAGFDVTAWPVDDISPTFAMTHQVVRHEWVGLAYYWLLGRSSSLFPAPHS